jgi:hypothetical protein
MVVVVGWIGHVSHHLRSLLDAFEFIVLCAFVCRKWYFDAQFTKTLLYSRGTKVWRFWFCSGKKLKYAHFESL